MEKPRKIECSLHGFDTKLGCPECGSAYAINGTIDAMSTWLEGEVPTVEEIYNRITATPCRIFKPEEYRELTDKGVDDLTQWSISEAIHELFKRKLTGKV